MIRHSSLFRESRDALESAYRLANPQGHWFSPSTLRFFKSRIADIYRVPNADCWLFISSEKGPSGTRAYTVRKMTGGDIRDVGGFQAHATLSRARTALKAHAVELALAGQIAQAQA